MDLFILYRWLGPIAGFCLAGILLAIWARWRNQTVNGSGYRDRVYRTIIWLGILVLVLDLGWLGGYWLAEVERPIHITSPFNDQSVNLRQQVMGTYEEIPADQALWVFVAPFRAPLYFPQPDPAILQPNFTWSSLTFVGSSDSAGQAFDIVLVLVDHQGLQAIRNYLAGKNRYGLNGLPPGATIVDKVTVWRK
jgi:hypothetical protein